MVDWVAPRRRRQPRTDVGSWPVVRPPEPSAQVTARRKNKQDAPCVRSGRPTKPERASIVVARLATLAEDHVVFMILGPYQLGHAPVCYIRLDLVARRIYCLYQPGCVIHVDMGVRFGKYRANRVELHVRLHRNCSFLDLAQIFAKSWLFMTGSETALSHPPLPNRTYG